MNIYWTTDVKVKESDIYQLDDFPESEIRQFVVKSFPTNRDNYAENIFFDSKSQAVYPKSALDVAMEMLNKT